MNIDPSVSEREVLIRYLESSGVTQQKEAAKLLREDDVLIKRLDDDVKYNARVSKAAIDFNTKLLLQIDEHQVYQSSGFWKRLKGLFQ